MVELSRRTISRNCPAIVPQLLPRYVVRTTQRFPLREVPPEFTVEITQVETLQLVTAIEVLAADNKQDEARREYLDKRRQMLLDAVHLMKIDLLRSGRRVLSLPLPPPVQGRPYSVILTRAGERQTAIWPIGMREQSPVVPVPLVEGDRDVVLDLHKAMTSIYDTFNYALTIDYIRPPAIPLTTEDALWADSLLSTWHHARMGGELL